MKLVQEARDFYRYGRGKEKQEIFFPHKHQ